VAYREPAHWQPKKRSEMPDHAFAYVKTVDGKKERKFPYKMERPSGSGKYVVSRKGAMSARNRAAQQIEMGRTEYIPVFNKMTDVLNRNFGYDLPKWAAHKRERDK